MKYLPENMHGSEPSAHIRLNWCPRQWWQRIEYHKSDFDGVNCPETEGTYSSCPQYKMKRKCWCEYDIAQARRELEGEGVTADE